VRCPGDVLARADSARQGALTPPTAALEDVLALNFLHGLFHCAYEREMSGYVEGGSIIKAN
jgi:hypothetical protein